MTEYIYIFVLFLFLVQFFLVLFSKKLFFKKIKYFNYCVLITLVGSLFLDQPLVMLIAIMFISYGFIDNISMQVIGYELEDIKEAICDYLDDISTTYRIEINKNSDEVMFFVNSPHSENVSKIITISKGRLATGINFEGFNKEILAKDIESELHLYLDKNGVVKNKRYSIILIIAMVVVYFCCIYPL